jgi:hypothetical protein
MESSISICEGLQGVEKDLHATGSRAAAFDIQTLERDDVGRSRARDRDHISGGCRHRRVHAFGCAESSAMTDPPEIVCAIAAPKLRHGKSRVHGLVSVPVEATKERTAEP